jgi:hypothetical protein
LAAGVVSVVAGINQVRVDSVRPFGEEVLPSLVGRLRADVGPEIGQVRCCLYQICAGR